STAWWRSAREFALHFLPVGDLRGQRDVRDDLDHADRYEDEPQPCDSVPHEREQGERKDLRHDRARGVHRSAFRRRRPQVRRIVRLHSGTRRWWPAEEDVREPDSEQPTDDKVREAVRADQQCTEPYEEQDRIDEARTSVVHRVSDEADAEGRRTNETDHTGSQRHPKFHALLEGAAIDRGHAVGVALGDRTVATGLVHGPPETGPFERTTLVECMFGARERFVDVHVVAPPKTLVT